MNRLMGVILVVALSGVPALATAADEGHLEVTTVVQKEEVFTNDAGKRDTRLVTASTVVPGERVVYTITFRNVSEDVADNIVITNPIDASLTYVDGSAFGPGLNVEFSVDGGATYGSRDDLTVIEDGAVRAAEPKDYTHVRWVMQDELAAGAQGTARFTAMLN